MERDELALSRAAVRRTYQAARTRLIFGSSHLLRWIALWALSGTLDEMPFIDSDD